MGPSPVKRMVAVALPADPGATMAVESAPRIAAVHGHRTQAHAPLWQDVPAAQMTPHDPQLNGSDDRSTQIPPQST